MSVEMLGALRILREDGHEADSWVRPSAKRLLCLLLLTLARGSIGSRRPRCSSRVWRHRELRTRFPSPQDGAGDALGFTSGQGLVTVKGQMWWVAHVDTDVDPPLALLRAPATTASADMLAAIADDNRSLLPGVEGRMAGRVSGRPRGWRRRCRVPRQHPGVRRAGRPQRGG